MQKPSHFVPGVPFGGEHDDALALERLVRDMLAYVDGRSPPPGELEAAPLVDDWVAVADPSAFRLAGTVVGHPTVGPGPAVTSRVYAIDRQRGWVRTYSRLWRLGRPASASARLDA